ncbi:hypothetical protein ACIA5D_06570 [Actinoplanes sp. NPDC051513]|uniref:hypothetical protein n=1 Tax=Actinoplanes sp. NPDC051513 TaxID=3363908 RepID=UPI0037BA3D81
MSDEPPPWARPRDDSGRLFASRRVNQQMPEPRRPARTPVAAAGPPPPLGPEPPLDLGPQPPSGPKPPVATDAADPSAVRRDPLIGLITSQVTYTKGVQAGRPGIGLVAVAMSAVITLAALVATALAGATGAPLLVIGSAISIASVAVVALANRLAVRRGMASECRFVMRAETGRSAAWTLRGAPQTGQLRTGDLIRIVPAKRIVPGAKGNGPSAKGMVPGAKGNRPSAKGNVPGAKGRARAVEVLAGPDGPVVRRITGRRLLAPLQWAGLALAVVLLALTTAVLNGAF